MSGVDDASLDGAELDLDGAEQLLPRQEDDQEVAKQRGDSRVGIRPFHERYEAWQLCKPSVVRLLYELSE